MRNFKKFKKKYFIGGTNTQSMIDFFNQISAQNSAQFKKNPSPLLTDKANPDYVNTLQNTSDLLNLRTNKVSQSNPQPATQSTTQNNQPLHGLAGGSQSTNDLGFSNQGEHTLAEGYDVTPVKKGFGQAEFNTALQFAENNILYANRKVPQTMPKFVHSPVNKVSVSSLEPVQQAARDARAVQGYNVQMGQTDPRLMAASLKSQEVSNQKVIEKATEQQAQLIKEGEQVQRDQNQVNVKAKAENDAKIRNLKNLAAVSEKEAQQENIKQNFNIFDDYQKGKFQARQQESNLAINSKFRQVNDELSVKIKPYEEKIVGLQSYKDRVSQDLENLQGIKTRAEAEGVDTNSMVVPDSYRRPAWDDKTGKPTLVVAKNAYVNSEYEYLREEYQRAVNDIKVQKDMIGNIERKYQAELANYANTRVLDRSIGIINPTVRDFPSNTTAVYSSPKLGEGSTPTGRAGLKLLVNKMKSFKSGGVISWDLRDNFLLEDQKQRNKIQMEQVREANRRRREMEKIEKEMERERIKQQVDQEKLLRQQDREERAYRQKEIDAYNERQREIKKEMRRLQTLGLK